MEKVCVIGLGYIGLPTALMMATNGVEVVGVDSDSAWIEQLQSQQVHFEEVGLQPLFEQACAAGMVFTDRYISTEVYIVAVPTPYDKNSKKIDPSYVLSAIQRVLEVCPQKTTLVIESTVAPGTIDRLIRPVVMKRAASAKKEIQLVHAPERIIPGNMVYELKNNSRTIGADDPAVGAAVKKLYRSFCEGQIVVTDIRTAEMTKVVENTFRDINIAFANELAKICRQDNMDVYEIIRIANMHPRVNILQPGPGVGGHCLSVDPWFLVGDYPGLTSLTRHARLINDSMPEFVLARVRDIMVECGMSDLSRVGLYGLTYKENVDDTRESPTLQLLRAQARHLGAPLKVYDPMVSETIADNQYHDLDAFLAGIDLVVLMVGHDEIKENMQKLSGKKILDTRNICPLPGAYQL